MRNRPEIFGDPSTDAMNQSNVILHHFYIFFVNLFRCPIFTSHFLVSRFYPHQTLLSQKLSINGIVLTKKPVKGYLQWESCHIESLLYPKDKQNVESATNFILAFIKACTKSDLPYNLIPIKLELRLPGEVFYGILSFLCLHRFLLD